MFDDLYVKAYTKDGDGRKIYMERLLFGGASDSWGDVPGAVRSKVTASEENALERGLLFTFNSYSLPMIDSGANGGHASKLFYTFPKGLFKLFGISVNLAIVGGAGIAADASLVGAIGSTATATGNATLETTEVYFVPSTACTLTASAGTFSAINTQASAIALVDSRSSSVPMYLNFAVDATGATADTTLTLTGTIHLNYIVV